MSQPASHASAIRSYSSQAGWDVSPDDRIGSPLGRRRGRILFRSFAVLALTGSGWVIYQNPKVAKDVAQVWASAAMETSLRWFNQTTREARATPQPAAGVETREAAPQIVVSVAPSAKPELPAKSGSIEILPLTPKAPAAAKPEAGKAEPKSATAAASPPALPPATVPAASTGYTAAPQLSPTTDPLLKQAEAVGLHPDLSTVVLKQLSPTDFRNAGMAIQKALAEIADNDALLWPRQRKASEALFKVHFVAGVDASSGPDCRRYVVTIAKDGWRTTALPMEVCGVRRVQAKEGFPAAAHP